MLKSIQQRDLDRNRWIKITMAMILGMIIVSMVITLIPGLMSGTADADLARCDRFRRRQEHLRPRLPAGIRSGHARPGRPAHVEQVYARQFSITMIFQRALEYRSGSPGHAASPPRKRRERIKQILPDRLGPAAPG